MAIIWPFRVQSTPEFNLAVVDNPIRLHKDRSRTFCKILLMNKTDTGKNSQYLLDGDNNYLIWYLLIEVWHAVLCDVNSLVVVAQLFVDWLNDLLSLMLLSCCSFTSTSANHLLQCCYAVCLFLSVCMCVFVSVSNVDFCIFSCQCVIINVTTIDVFSVYVEVYSVNLYFNLIAELSLYI